MKSTSELTVGEALIAALVEVGFSPESAEALREAVFRKQASDLYLTRTGLAQAAGMSPRALDNLLANPAIPEKLGCWKTGLGRNSHWRFPPDAPVRLRRLLGAKVAV